MAVVAPFRGVRYNPEKIERLEDVVTPPYDVISTDDEKKTAAKKSLFHDQSGSAQYLTGNNRG